MPPTWGEKEEQQTLHRPRSKAERSHGGGRGSSEPGGCHSHARELPGFSIGYFPSEHGDNSQIQKEKFIKFHSPLTS